MEIRKKYEVVHYWGRESELFIGSNANLITVVFRNFEFTIALPLVWYKRILSRSRLLSRLLRLDKSNVFPILENKKLTSIVIIYQSVVFYWSEKTGLVKTLSMPRCRNVMHNAITVCDEGYIYFGEYCANKNRKDEVGVYCSKDKGLSWQNVFNFKPGTIKHIHNIQWDEIENKLWITTGDLNGECKILVVNKEFSAIEELGDGSQIWRTCHLFFAKESVYWGMDSPLTDCFIFRMKRSTREALPIAEISGPAWYGKSLGEAGYLLTTSVEPGVNCIDNTAHVYYSKDLENWQVLLSVEKDSYPLVYFRFGSVFFSHGEDGEKDCYVGFDAVKELDGQTKRLDELRKSKWMNESTYWNN